MSETTGRVRCTCHSEVRVRPGDGSPCEWTEVVEVLDPACPVHGPSGRGREWVEVTNTSDVGHAHYVDVSP